MFRFLTLIFFLTHSSLVLSNESLSKINNLYLNGVLDKGVYLESLNKLGVDTNNEIFQNLFDLFSNRTLDLQNYEKSISNMINLSNNKENNKINSFSGALSKKYSSIKCVGDKEICTIFKEGVLFTYDGDKVHWDDEFKKGLLNSPDVAAVMNERFSKFGANKLNASLTVRLTGAVMVDFVAIGNFDKDPFEMEKISIKYQGQDIAAVVLEEA